MAGINDLQGNIIAAEQMYLECIDRRIKIMGEEHLETIITQTNYCAMLTNSGRYTEAAKMIKKLHSTAVQILGEEHPQYFEILAEMARQLAHQNSYAEASKLIEKRLAIETRKLGEDHPITMNTANDLAMSYLILRRIDKAEHFAV